jgi:hypothetical protein
METENAIVENSKVDTGSTEAGSDDSQVKEKTFTQDELDGILQKRLSQATKKYADVNLNEYNELKSLKTQIEEEQLIKRQEFDKVLQKTKQQSAKEVGQLRSELEKIKVDGALISASSNAKAVNPAHVATLLRNNIKMTDEGTVTVVDNEGNARFDDKGDALSVGTLVDEFLNEHSYFKVAGPSGAGSTGNTDTRSSEKFDLSKLDMRNPEHRQKYKDMRQKGLV